MIHSLKKVDSIFLHYRNAQNILVSLQLNRKSISNYWIKKNYLEIEFKIKAKGKTGRKIFEWTVLIFNDKILDIENIINFLNTIKL